MQVGRAYVTIDPTLPFRYHSPPGHRRVAVIVKGSLQVPSMGDSLLSQNVFLLFFCLIKRKISVLILLFECNLPSESVYLSLDSLVNNHITDFLFGSILGDTYQS